MQRFYIIADDLTGANDAGVQLSKIGICSTVFLDYKHSSLQSIEDVAIIDTDSRAISEEAAYETIQKASSIFRKQGYEQVYKKLDSTLRGNVAAELAALVSVYQPEIMVVAPAFPKMNRQTMNGYQYVNGEQVSETEFGRDPKTPVKESFIPNLLKKYVNGRICLIDHVLLNSPTENLIKEIEENTGTGQGTTWFICDAASDNDLKLIANTFAQLNKKTVWAGSAGLIEYLPNALQLKQAEIKEQEHLGIDKTLTVSASLSLVTKQQLEMVRVNTNTHFVELDPVSLIKKNYKICDIIDEIKKEFSKKHFVLFVDSTVENREATKQLGTELSLGNTQISEAISIELGVIAKAIIHSMPAINGLVLTGGDTAKAVCNQLNMNQMQLYTEIESGLPLGKLGNESTAGRYWTVTKAGGFGNDYSLLNALKFMTREGVQNG